MTDSKRLMAAGLVLALLIPVLPAASAKETKESKEKRDLLTYEYKIGPDDVLAVDVWKKEELSREVVVRPDGFISLPLIQDIKAEGLTAAELAAVLRQAFKSFVSDPEVSVTVREARSYKVYVLGKVNSPGMFIAKSPITALQAVSMAGGFAPFADTDDIVVIRRINGRELRFPVDYKDIVKGKKPEQNIVLQAGDTLVVP